MVPEIVTYAAGAAFVVAVLGFTGAITWLSLRDEAHAPAMKRSTDTERSTELQSENS